MSTARRVVPKDGALMRLARDVRRRQHHDGVARATQFIPRDLVPPVVQQLDNYKTFKALTTEWVDLALALAKDKLATNKARLKSGVPRKRTGRIGSKS